MNLYIIMVGTQAFTGIRMIDGVVQATFKELDKADALNVTVFRSRELAQESIEELDALGYSGEIKSIFMA